MSVLFRGVLTSVIFIGAGMVPAVSATLSVGSGDGSIQVVVDEFGRSFDATYDPIGPVGAAGAIFDSYIALNSFGGYSPLDEFGVDVQVIEQTPTVMRSAFTINFLDFTLTQSVVQNIETGTGAVIGATLTQSLGIVNTADVPNSFQLRRYLDGDLQFDGTIADGGGVTNIGGNRVLFEVDSVAIGEGGDTEATFVGINATGGQVPANGSFQISSYSGLDTLVRSIGALNDFVQSDTDGDGFIDEPYDVTMALQNNFSLGAGQSATYTTQTIFGNSTPPAPGSSESFPLLPNDSAGGPNGNSFVFELPEGAIAERDTIFIDPDIATGYTYAVSGAEFYSVTAPSFAAVADPDGYLLSYGSTTVALASGATFLFADGIVEFLITGIDPALALDPTNALAFVTGVAFDNITGDMLVTQTPIVGSAPAIPLPATLWLFLTALAGGGAIGLRRRAAGAAA